VFRNEAGAPRIAVRLTGRSPNTQAIGAKVELLGAPVPHQKSEVVAGGSYLSGSDTLRVFAPGTATERLRLRVTWRDGTATEIPNVEPNRLYEIFEATVSRTAPGTGKSEKAAPLFQDLSHLLAHTHHEDAFDDFARQPLLPRKLSQAGPG